MQSASFLFSILNLDLGQINIPINRLLKQKLHYALNSVVLFVCFRLIASQKHFSNSLNIVLRHHL